MKSVLGSIAGLLCAIACYAQAPAFRPPAVPLVVHDPYFSIWSMADKLTDEDTKHWTGTTQSLCSLVRIDGKVYRVMGTSPRGAPALNQTGLEVLPTHTIYHFADAGIRLTLTFLNPALPDDLDVLSRPATYITWHLEAGDGKPHSVQVYFDASSELAVNTNAERVQWGRDHVGNLDVLRMGSERQPILEKSGDDLRIDWGYLFLTAPAGTGLSEAATDRGSAIKEFSGTGRAPSADNMSSEGPYPPSLPVLALSFDASVNTGATSRHAVMAYDDGYAIEFFQRRLRPYWARNGAGPAQMLEDAVGQYDSINERAKAFDDKLMSNLRAAGGEQYAELAALAYPQTLAAHKLTADIDGKPLFFSKENFSNGSIDTVDVTYPSSPFFLLFNPELLEAQLRPIMVYAALPRWKFPFAPHDLGRYPLADGQQYGGRESSEEDQMPVEESGNMLIMSAALSQIEGNANFARECWPLLTKWAEYLRNNGFDPENQLSTDDFAGHLAHNANLSIKAIIAIAAYGKMAGMLGKSDVAEEFTHLAKQDAEAWVQKDREGNHYKLAFDRSDTWSQKYNLVWDDLLNLHLFPPQIIQQETAFYLEHENTYGLPLDNRAKYTKLDWLAWTASLTDSKPNFEKIFVDPGFRFANQSPTRVPLTDWYDTVTAKQVGFQARSVVGGIFLRMLYEPNVWKEYASAALKASPAH